LEQAREASSTATELAKRLGATGAVNKLEQARSQSFHAELVAQLGNARLRATSERERLVRMLGLSAETTRLKLPAQLPPLPARVRNTERIEVEALRRRIDLRMARIEVDLLAKAYGLTSATRFINLFDVAGIAKNQKDNGDTIREAGPGIELQIP